MSAPSPSDEGRLVHLGIGNFARAHTLVATQRAGSWSVSAFTGRTAAMADALNAQSGQYGLIVRGAEDDEVSIVDVIDEVFPADDVDALVRLVADPFTAVVTLTITEKGYAAGNDPATSAPARLALGLKARREAGVTEPIALVSCDNLTGNGEVLREAVLAAADEDTRAWFEDHVDVVSSMVDRITPSADEGAADLVQERTGLADTVPVVTEPFTEWVVEDSFRGRRPEWEKAGVQFTDDLEIHELRKLRLLNGAHTLMAYAGQVAGVERVDEAIGHREVRALVEQLWSEARATLDLPAADLDAYTDALEARFRNPRLADNLIRIAADGSVKLPVRALPVIAELGGPEKAPGEVAAVAAWTAWVTDRVRAGAEVKDPRADEIATAAAIEDPTERVTALLALLDVPAGDPLVAAVVAEELRLPRP
ncbi:mannitol dehydrogenase family protein [Brachybacterium alimentarium]|uniref:Mannitol-1-phosphate 5-dehydrogenase n=1 Tax=Brachybacterium alimentarium TaxID=47845 RepID=A0A2A3YJM0_9MICO|nr:mannitol dehydrogenase family protein [Brachybacterium alimentarium]PCC33702.1 mannitol-1-phosphate 5-dehydrogenase [Brachybacterium alimentarium]PCC39295.1 mannitol-1-phosphate 5-dehydrogenase [Brachybacterium alimentarium]RCS82257.1 mannitol dehydrogenase family protein [Brachybacterium alimentarium]RCS92334.1 mannitol dehydrogenase family protein [Brachybacterium alimentarium]